MTSPSPTAPYLDRPLFSRPLNLCLLPISQLTDAAVHRLSRRRLARQAGIEGGIAVDRAVEKLKSKGSGGGSEDAVEAAGERVVGEDGADVGVEGSIAAEGDGETDVEDETQSTEEELGNGQDAKCPPG